MDTTTIDKGTETREKAIALLRFLGREALDFEQASYDDNVWESGNIEYMVLTDEEADEKATDYIKDSLWAFNPSFLSNYCDLPETIFTALQPQCESANEAILALVDRDEYGIESFVEDAISCDGRGRFMSSYDGNEEEVKINNTYYYIYRIN